MLQTLVAFLVPWPVEAAPEDLLGNKAALKDLLGKLLSKLATNLSFLRVFAHLVYIVRVVPIQSDIKQAASHLTLLP